MLWVALRDAGPQFLFLAAGVFSVSGQHCILRSVPRFDPTSQAMALLERNAEGIITVFVLIVSFAFAVMCDFLLHDSASGMTVSLIPFALMAVSTCVALPMGLLSLRRQASMSDISSYLIFDNSVNFSESDEEFENETLSPFLEASLCATNLPSCKTMLENVVRPQQSDEVSPESGTHQPEQNMSFGGTAHSALRPYRNGLVDSVHMTCFMISSCAAILLLLLVPFAFGYIAYYYVYRSVVARHVGFTFLTCLWCGFGVSVLMPLFFSKNLNTSRTKWKRWLCGAFWCYLMYSIPTAIVLGALTLPLIVKTTGAWVFAMSMVVVSCISTIPHIHFVSLLFNVCILVYFLYYHLYACLLQKREVFTPWKCVADVSFTAFWFWYFRRYVGKPHISGSLYSERVHRFFRCWIFNSVADYFDLNVIVDGKEEAVVGGKQGPHDDYVNLNDPQNKYLFSFHPHGVLPGSVLWVPNTAMWREAVGRNTENYISAHCADVIFAVPVLRDIVLSLGGLSVLRRAIEGSLSRGNSVIVVTGGQAEMLLSKYSDTEMHLVTHHNGFIRLALAHQVPLVPILCFGEHNVLSNVSFPRLQRHAVKKLGFPFPTVPFGKWYLPLPNACPLTVVVGRPLRPEPGMGSPEVPEHVRRYKQRYFDYLRELFFKYREQAGYPRMTLALHFHEEVRVFSEPVETCGEAQPREEE